MSRLRSMTPSLWSVLAVVAALTLTAPAVAQPDGATAEPTAEAEQADAPADAEADEHEPAATGDAEQAPVEQTSAASKERSVPGGTLLLVAYIFLWVLVVGFVAVVLRHQRRLDAELDALERRIDDIAGVDTE